MHLLMLARDNYMKQMNDLEYRAVIIRLRYERQRIYDVRV